MWAQLVNLPSAFSARRAAAGALSLALLAAAGWAQAGEAGRIVFVSGDVQSGKGRVALNDAVNEGDELATGKDGYVYLKTVDDGLLILRPSSRARITTYHVDTKVPANTQVKLELLSGVARTVSGKAVKEARQNFRFNTPVAAIGVRGTDFTVFTDQETSNVTVLSGAIVVSGFDGACSPGGIGPCEHQASRELSAGQAGQMLQVKRGQAVPKLLSGAGVAPDAVVPPRNDEPATKGGGSASSGDVSLDAQKTSSVLQQGLGNVRNTFVPPTPIPPVVVPVEPLQPPPPPPPQQLVWGRWAVIMDQAPTIDTAKELANGGQRLAMNSYFAIFRTKGADWEIPQQGAVSFNLAASEALVNNETANTLTPATLRNGQFVVDFGSRTYSTSFDLQNGSNTYRLRSDGYVGNKGDLAGKSQFEGPTNMAVSGGLGPQNNAAYIFSTRLDAGKTATGVTYWTR